jgi:NAD(P)-dependent dehydrogenase (short-subunit alcohol dehydrogenase family)
MHKKIEELFDLTGEVAIVTGGTGKLGPDFVGVLARAGAKVASFSLSGDVNKNRKLAALIQEFPGQILVMKVDVTKPDQIAKAFSEVENILGVPSILVNNAGIDVPPNASNKDFGPFLNYPLAAWNALIESHLTSTLLMSQAFARTFPVDGKKSGRIINIASTYGVVAPDQAIYESFRRKGKNFWKPVAYTVSKAGIIGFTKWLAGYCGENKINIRVNAIVPGGVNHGHDADFVLAYGRNTMLGRMAEYGEYDAALLFLASDKASSYATGSILTVDGGWTAK